MSGKNEVRELFLAALKKADIVPPKTLKVQRGRYRSWNVTRDRPAIDLWWDKKAFGWSEHVAVHFIDKPLSVGIDMLVIAYLKRLKEAGEFAEKKEQANVVRRMNAEAARVARLAAAVKLGFPKLPERIEVHGNGQLLFSLRVESFDAEHGTVGLYCQTDTLLSALKADTDGTEGSFGRKYLECQLTLEGEQEIT